MDRILPENSFAIRMKVLVDVVGSAEKLARLSGMSARVIGKYISGETDPSRERLISLAKAADVNVLWLATGEGPMRREENSSLQINGNKNFQVNGSVVHAVHTVFAKEDRESRAPEPGLASEPPPAAALDPLDAAYLDDWHKLSEVGKMRVWTIVKEEIEKERKGEK